MRAAARSPDYVMTPRRARGCLAGEGTSRPAIRGLHSTGEGEGTSGGSTESWHDTTSRHGAARGIDLPACRAPGPLEPRRELGSKRAGEAARSAVWGQNRIATVPRRPWSCARSPIAPV